MSQADKTALEGILGEIAKMDDEDAVAIYKIQRRLEELSNSEIKNYSKGYSRQRITEQLNELSDILDARMSMQLIADGQWDPETDARRPVVTENGVFSPEENDEPAGPTEPTPSTEPTQEPELNFFQRIIKAIVDFFRKLFGWIMGD